MYAVNGSVVELDSLTDPDRSRSDNDDCLGIAGILDRSLVLAACRSRIICRIEIGRYSLELACTGIDHLVCDGYEVLVFSD